MARSDAPRSELVEIELIELSEESEETELIDARRDLSKDRSVELSAGNLSFSFPGMLGVGWLGGVVLLLAGGGVF